jgi:maleylacetate reductase
MMEFMQPFELQGLPWNVHFAPGAIRRLPGILEQFGLRRALVLSTPGRTQQRALLSDVLGDTCAGAFAGAAVHVPSDVVAAALHAAAECRADCTVSIGGGSTTGLGKLLRREAGLPQVAIPMTYAGSEMTPIWGVSESGAKRTGREPRVLPVAVLYDPQLVAGLSPAIAGPSALNAMAQAIANVSTGPVPGLLAREALRVLAGGLPRVMEDAGNVESQAAMLLGACLAGAALGLGRSGLHHRVCHVLGGMYNLPHAELHAVILPHSVAGMARANSGDPMAVADALGASDPASHLYGMLKQYCPRHSLQALGLSAADVDAAADSVRADAIDADEARRVLRNAFTGGPPGAATE